MDLLANLLDVALGAECPAGDERIAALVARLGDSEFASADLAVLEAAAVAEFNTLYGDGTSYDPAQAPRLEALADVTDALRSVTAARAGLSARVAALAGRVQTVPAPVVVDPGHAVAGGDDGTALSSAPPATAGPGVSAPDPAQGIAAEDPAPTAVPAPPSPRPSTAVVVAAAGGGAVSAPAPAAVVPWRSFAITASAEVPNTPYGANLTLEQLASAAAARYGTFPTGQVTSGPLKANVGLIHRQHAASHTLSGDHSDVAVLDRVADERRLPGGSLVAAAGRALTAAAVAPSVINDVWCTPSETDYTLCPSLATVDGMLDLPTTGLPARGGIRYPVWSQYPEQAIDSGRNNWHGNVINYPEPAASPGAGLDNPDYFHNGPLSTPAGTGLGNLKRYIQGPCVTWAEARSSVAYLWVVSDILRDRTFPEGLTRFLSDVLVHHQHYLNEGKIAYLEAHADPLPAFSVTNGVGSIGATAFTAIDRVSLLVEWFRGRYKMSKNSTLEIIAPEWFSEYLKRDIEKRQFRPSGAVSDAEITALFGAYASRVQWIRDWQELPDGTAVSGRIMPPGGWPSSVKLMAYPAGSWVYSEGNVLTLGVQYDSTLLATNQYSAMFTEDSWLLLNRCNRTFVVELTELCANGAVGPNKDACAIKVTPLLTAPLALANGTATATTVPLSWTAVTGASSYQVQRSTDAGATWLDVTTAAGGSPTGASTTVTGLTTATAYRFRVAAIDPNGIRGANSAPVSVTTA